MPPLKRLGPPRCPPTKNSQICRDVSRVLMISTKQPSEFILLNCSTLLIHIIVWILPLSTSPYFTSHPTSSPQPLPSLLTLILSLPPTLTPRLTLTSPYLTPHPPSSPSPHPTLPLTLPPHPHPTLPLTLTLHPHPQSSDSSPYLTSNPYTPSSPSVLTLPFL